MLYSSVSTRLNNRFCCITKTFNGTNEKWNTNSTKRKRYVMADRSTPTEHFNAVSHVCISRAVCAFCSIPFRFGTEWRVIQQTNEQDFSLYMNTLFLSFHMSVCVCVCMHNWFTNKNSVLMVRRPFWAWVSMYVCTEVNASDSVSSYLLKVIRDILCSDREGNSNVSKIGEYRCTVSNHRLNMDIHFILLRNQQHFFSFAQSDGMNACTGTGSYK